MCAHRKFRINYKLQLFFFFIKFYIKFPRHKYKSVFKLKCEACNSVAAHS